MEILVGTDPEVFVRRRSTGMFLSAHTFFPGTKEAPFPVRDGAIQVDGVAAEFNITPADNFADFAGNIATVTGLMQSILANQDTDLELVVTPTATFTREYFDALPEETKKLGCSPDYNAWTRQMNEPPKTDKPFRTGAGHIHLGWEEVADVTDEDFVETCREVTKNLDASLYVMSHCWDDDRSRRSLYGKKGAFRPKLYGMEYRVLSNMFLQKPAIVKWCFEAAQHACKLALQDNLKLYKSASAKRYLDYGVYTVNELLYYNSHLMEFGFEPLPKELIEAA